MTPTEYADSLRLIADFYEAHEDFPLPHVSSIGMDIFSVYTTDELAACARALGTVEKFTVGANLFGIRRQFGALRLEVIVNREIACTRRVIGTEEIPEHVTPAHIREIVEWDCHSLLSAAMTAAEG